MGGGRMPGRHTVTGGALWQRNRKWTSADSACLSSLAPIMILAHWVWKGPGSKDNSTSSPETPPNACCSFTSSRLSVSLRSFSVHSLCLDLDGLSEPGRKGLFQTIQVASWTYRVAFACLTQVLSLAFRIVRLPLTPRNSSLTRTILAGDDCMNLDL